jgi:hypothetical protein
MEAPAGSEHKGMISGQQANTMNAGMTKATPVQD